MLVRCIYEVTEWKQTTDRIWTNGGWSNVLKKNKTKIRFKQQMILLSEIEYNKYIYILKKKEKEEKRKISSSLRDVEPFYEYAAVDGFLMNNTCLIGS